MNRFPVPKNGANGWGPGYFNRVNSIRHMTEMLVTVWHNPSFRGDLDLTEKYIRKIIHHCEIMLSWVEARRNAGQN